MKNLLILRHAKSSWKIENLADHERPLSKRGLDAAPRVGATLNAWKLNPDLILSSTAQRARQTAELAASTLEQPVKIRLVDELYAAEPQTILHVLSGVNDRCERVMIVGHNPGLEALVELLTHEVQPMPTAGLARIELPVEHWKEISSATRGRLVSFWKPKEAE